jgi:hypothetical protein
MKKKAHKMILISLLGLATFFIRPNILFRLTKGRFSITLPGEHISEFSEDIKSNFPGRRLETTNPAVSDAGRESVKQNLVVFLETHILSHVSVEHSMKGPVLDPHSGKLLHV